MLLIVLKKTNLSFLGDILFYIVIYILLIGLNIMMDKNCFFRIFRLILRMLVMIMNSLKKYKKESVIISNNSYQRYNKYVFAIR